MVRLLVFVFIAGLCPGQLAWAEPSSKPKNGECTAYWRSRGFSTDGAAGKNTLFRPADKETYPAFYKRLDRKNCAKEWLVVIYMAADNDLSPFSFRDLWEMEASGSHPSVDVIAFQDAGGDTGMKYFHIAKSSKAVDYHDALENFVKKKGIGDQDPKEQEIAFLDEEGQRLVSSPVVREMPEGDSGNVKTMRAFLDWSLANYPSQRVMLLGWSHGQGFDAPANNAEIATEVGRGWERRTSNDGRQGGFAFDSTPKRTHMAVTEMAKEVRASLDRFRGTGREMEILGSDACLNQQVEFGYEWLGVATYVFGSSTIVQKKGFNYRTLLEWWGSHPYNETQALAEKIPALYGGSVGAGAGRKYSSYYDPFATMATWSVGALVPLRRGLEDLAAKLTAWINAGADDLEKLQRTEELRKEIGKSLRLGSISNDLFNLLQVFETWTKNKLEAGGAEETWSPLADEINNVRSVLNRSVLAKYIGKKYVSGLLRTSQGVAVWLPASERELKEMLPKFQKSRFYQGEGASSAWATLISHLFSP